MDMNYPKISIVTPSYNQGKYIEETILSVVNQNYPNLEYIIIDGGSTDDSVSIIKKYEKYLTYWISEPDKGQSDAINKGLKKCTGKLFNWLNSDDTLEPNSLFTLASNYNRHQKKMVFAGYLTIINHPEIPKHHIYTGKTEKDTLINYNINQPATYYRLDIFKKIGINVNLHYVMDLDIWFRFILTYGNKKIKYINSILANFRYHELSKSVSDMHKNNYGREERALRFYLGLISGLQINDMKIALPYFFENFQAEKNKFNIKQINSKFTKQIRSFFYKDCAKKSYALKKHNMARKYFCLYIINGCVDFDFNMLLFIAKSYIRPNWLVNLYRKRKTLK